jgi:hypothetical protein
MADPLTPTEYAARRGLTCPACHTGNGTMLFGPLNVADGCVSQPVRCLTCQAAWTDRYRLEGYVDLNLSQQGVSR